MNEIQTDTLAFYGGAVKALGGGKVAGYGILFTTAADPDLQGEFFTKETNLMIDVGDRRPILYRHGMHPMVQDRRGGTATLKSLDDEGAFFEGELDVSDGYWKRIYQLAEQGKLGWSTGSMPHLVKKEAKELSGKKADHLRTWPVGEISLTPCPVESRTAAFPVKSVTEADELDALIKSLEVEEDPNPVSLDGLPALKALCESLSPANVKMSEHSVVADAAVKELLTHGTIFVDAFKGYRVRVDRLVEFRKERGKHISESQEQSLRDWRDGLSKVRKDLESVEQDLETTLRLSDRARGEVDAAEKHASFLMQQLERINSSIIAKE